MPRQGSSTFTVRAEVHAKLKNVLPNGVGLIQAAVERGVDLFIEEYTKDPNAITRSSVACSVDIRDVVEDLVRRLADRTVSAESTDIVLIPRDLSKSLELIRDLLVEAQRGPIKDPARRILAKNFLWNLEELQRL